LAERYSAATGLDITDVPLGTTEDKTARTITLFCCLSFPTTAEQWNHLKKAIVKDKPVAFANVEALKPMNSNSGRLWLF
jgi:hypothetical protein